MKLKKTKSAVAVLLAVMLLVSTMIVAPVTASAATAGESVGDWHDTTHNFVRYTLDGETWQNATVSWDGTYFITPEIAIPEGVTRIYAVMCAEWDNGPRWFKQGSQSREIQPKFGDSNQRYFVYWDNANHDPGTQDLPIDVLPTSKIRFIYQDFNNDPEGDTLVYGCYMSSAPTNATKSVGNVSINVTPESDVYTNDRAVSITVSDIPADLPPEQVTVDTHFGTGSFVPANTQNDATNHTITITGVLNGFTANDVGTGYVAEATASSTYTYSDNYNVTYSFTDSSATDTYDITEPTVQPTVENKPITVDLSVTPDTIQENQSATLTAIVHYPVEMPEGWGTDYVGVTVSDDGGTHFLTPDTTSNDANNHRNVYTFILNENKYSVSDSPVMFSALATYSGTDYVASPTLTYHFDITPPAFATLTVTNPSYENENVPVGTLDVSVTPASDYNSAARTVTAVLSDISQFIDNKDDINVTMTDSKGYTLTNPAVTIGTNTVTYVYTVAANTYPNAADTVTYTGTASCDQTKTVDYTIYSFTPCSDTADTEIIIDTLDPEMTPDAIMLTLLSNLKTSIGVKTANLAGYENVYMVVSIPEANITETITDSYTNSIYTAFDFNKIHPQILGDNFSAVVYGTKNGVEYHGNPYVNNVRDYSYRLLERIADSTTPRNIAQKALLVELLNYAASIQLWKGYKTDELANARLTAEQQAYSNYTSDCDNKVNKNYIPRDNAVATWYQQRLVFDSNIKLDISFQTTVMPQDGWYVIAKANGVEHRIDTILRPGPETGQLQSFYYVTLDDLMANQLDSEVLVTLYDENNNPLSSTMMTTINSFYVNNKDTLPADQVAVLEAMVKYGRAAMALSENP